MDRFESPQRTAINNGGFANNGVGVRPNPAPVVFGQCSLGIQLDSRLMDSCITQLKAQGPSRTYHESHEEEEEVDGHRLDVEGSVDSPTTASGCGAPCVPSDGQLVSLI